MSVELLIGTGREDESRRYLMWDTKFGTASWVAQQVQQRVTDTGLKAALQPYIDERHFFVDFGAFPETQTAQVVGVILGALLPAARHEWPPDNDPFLMVPHIEDLVTSTRAWLDELNAWRRAQGRPEFEPTRVSADVPKPDPTRLLMTPSVSTRGCQSDHRARRRQAVPCGGSAPTRLLITDSVYLAAFWGARPDTAKTSARTLATTLARLREIDPMLAGWSLRIGPADGVPYRIDTSQKGLTSLLRKAVRSRLFYGLGSTVVWRTDTAAPSKLMLTFGCMAAGTANAFVVRFPAPAPDTEQLYRSSTMRAMARVVVEDWSPDWAVVASDQIRHLYDIAFPSRPFAGWLTYLRSATPANSDRAPELEPLGDGVQYAASPEPLRMIERDLDEATSVLRPFLDGP